MILIGQYDSPFVRRVGIALTLYGHVFEHRPWSTFGQGDMIAPFNPLRRVPTLILDDGSVIIESAYMLDWLDEQAGEAALIARTGALRQKALYLVALSTGMADKAVSLFYEQMLHEEASDLWLTRCRTQIGGVLDVLERERAAADGPWFFGESLSHADVALGCALNFCREAHRDQFDWSPWPALADHGARCEALDVFRAISQPFIPPSRNPD